MERPRLRRGVRLTYDTIRDTHVLLYPEGVLLPNPTAATVLGLCDGHRTVPDIVSLLGERYCGVREDEVHGVLARLVERRMVEWV